MGKAEKINPVKPYINQKHPNYLLQLEAGDVIENLHIGAVTKNDAPQEDELVVVTIWGDIGKTIFALKMDSPHNNRLAFWDAFVMTRETSSLPEIRPERLLER